MSQESTVLTGQHYFFHTVKCIVKQWVAFKTEGINNVEDLKEFDYDGINNVI